MKRPIFGVLFSCITLAGCAGDIPTSPDTTLPAGIPTALTLSVDRTRIPATDLVGAITVTVAVAVQSGTTPERVPVQLVLKIDGIDDPMSDILYTNADGRAFKDFNLPRSSTIAVSVGSLSESVRVTRAAPAPIPDDPEPPIIDDDDDDLPDPEPRILVSLTADTTAPDTLTPVTFTATATPIYGAAAVTSFAWDFENDGTIDETTTTGEATHTYATAGAVTARVTVTNGTQSAVATRAITVSTPGLVVTLTADKGEIEIGEEVTFSVAVTSTTGDVPSDIQYAWDDEGTGEGDFVPGDDTLTTTFAAPDSTTIVRVRATSDSTGAEGIVSGTISVSAPALLVSLSSTPSTVSIGTPVTFTASVTSSGAVPSTLTYEWDENGDGVYDATGSANTREITFGSTGNQTVRVRVTDPASGRTATTTRTITVS